MPANTMAERRSALTVEQESIRAKRGAAVLDGHRFDDRRLREIESEQDRLDDAEAESARRDREAATAAQKALEAAKLTKAQECHAARMKALETAEGAAAAMSEALRTFLDNTVAVGDAYPALGLTRRTAEQRVSRMLAATLAPIASNTHGFGTMNWPSVPSEFRDKWVDVEQRHTGAATAHLTEPKG